jgi:hypothetical protein
MIESTRGAASFSAVATGPVPCRSASAAETTEHRATSIIMFESGIFFMINKEGNGEIHSLLLKTGYSFIAYLARLSS